MVLLLILLFVIWYRIGNTAIVGDFGLLGIDDTVAVNGVGIELSDDVKGEVAWIAVDDAVTKLVLAGSWIRFFGKREKNGSFTILTFCNLVPYW